jgi:hypothetical protein
VAILNTSLRSIRTSHHTSGEPCPMARSIDNNSERDLAPIRRRMRATLMLYRLRGNVQAGGDLPVGQT